MIGDLRLGRVLGSCWEWNKNEVDPLELIMDRCAAALIFE
jgi:hypothetical protein